MSCESRGSSLTRYAYARCCWTMLTVFPNSNTIFPPSFSLWIGTCVPRLLRHVARSNVACSKRQAHHYHGSTVQREPKPTIASRRSHRQHWLAWCWDGVYKRHGLRRFSLRPAQQQQQQQWQQQRQRRRQPQMGCECSRHEPIGPG